MYETERDNRSCQKNNTMLEKRGCQPLVYPQNRTNAIAEPSNFASSLIFLLLMYKVPENAGVESEATTLRGKVVIFSINKLHEKCQMATDFD